MTDGSSGEGPVTKTNVGRLTNGIFVFTLLLLFKNVRIPSFSDTFNGTTADVFGLMQIPDIISFINAFLIIALFWMITFHIFHQIRKIDRLFLYIHFGFLIFIVFIPITSHLYQVFDGNPIIAFFFHSNILLISIFLMGEWYHIRHTTDIQSSNVDNYTCGCTSRKLLYMPISAIIGIILSYLEIPMTRSVYYGTMIIFLSDWIIIRYRPFSKWERKS